jgi:hypothetical protein
MYLRNFMFSFYHYHKPISNSAHKREFLFCVDLECMHIQILLMTSLSDSAWKVVGGQVYSESCAIRASDRELSFCYDS